MTERGEGRLPPPHTRLRLLGIFLKAAGSQHHFSQGRERPCWDLCFRKLILAAGWKGCRWQVGGAGGEEAGRESACGDSEASTASRPLPNSKSNKLPPERGLQFSPSSQNLSRQRRAKSKPGGLSPLNLSVLVTNTIPHKECFIITVSYRTLRMSLEGGYYEHSHFTDGETKALRATCQRVPSCK